jgi:hypothetical protein
MNDTSIQQAVEYIRTHEPPFEVFRIAREIHARPLEVIYALLSEDLQAAYKWRPCGVHDTQWVRYKTGTIKYEQKTQT